MARSRTHDRYRPIPRPLYPLSRTVGYLTINTRANPMTSPREYKTYTRSALSFRDYATARKTTVSVNLTVEEALADCKAYNDSRTQRQINRGTKLEFTKE